MEYPANDIQNSANFNASSHKSHQNRRSFHKGFLFDTPGAFILTTCAACAGIRSAGEQRCNAYPARRWVLDFSLEYSEGADFFCGTDASGMLPRPARMAHLYPPRTSYLEKTDRECWLSSAWMIFESDSAFLHAMTENSTQFARIHDPNMKIGHRLKTLASSAAVEGNAGYFHCSSIAFEILSELAKVTRIPGTCGEYSTASESRLTPVAEQTIRYLESHFREPLTVPNIARVLGMSPSTISHRFHAESGETIVKALQRIRLEQSIPYLLRGTPLKEIAPATGFQNEFYYSKVFRDHYGVPPSTWREINNGTCRLETSAQEKRVKNEISNP